MAVIKYINGYLVARLQQEWGVLFCFDFFLFCTGGVFCVVFWGILGREILIFRCSRKMFRRTREMSQQVTLLASVSNESLEPHIKQDRVACICHLNKASSGMG